MSAKNAGFLSIISFIVCFGCAVAQTYTVTDLGPGQGNGINDLGQVVGVSQCAGFGEFATIWTGGTCSTLGPPAFDTSAAFAINNAGLAVGFASGSGTTAAILFVGSSFTVLGGQPAGIATDINQGGVMVGSTFVFNTGGGVGNVATVWPAGCVSITCATLLIGLGHSAQPFGFASAVNNAGQVVGNSLTSDGQLVPTLWTRGAAMALGGLTGYPNCMPASINNPGVIAGYCYSLGSNGEVISFMATRWTGLNATPLPPLAGATSSIANGVNNSGLIVGSSITSDQTFATVWKGTTAIDLNAVSVHGSNVTLQDAMAINSRGQIVVNGFDSVANSGHVYLLTPRGMPRP